MLFNFQTVKKWRRKREREREFSVYKLIFLVMLLSFVSTFVKAHRRAFSNVYLLTKLRKLKLCDKKRHQLQRNWKLRNKVLYSIDYGGLIC